MKTSRRSFIKAAAAAGALGFPTIVPSSVFGQTAPSNRVNLAAIGWGDRANNFVRNQFVKALPGMRMVAVYDCNRRRCAAGAKAINEIYQGDVCKPAESYRAVLERKDVDGVVIATPDHWHTPMAYYAAQAKKDIYVEKPLTVALNWAKKLREVVAKNNVIVQYGTQQRSMPEFRRVANLVRNGYLGHVSHVDAWSPGLRAKGMYEKVYLENRDKVEPAEVPDWLDYDVWTGPAPLRPFTELRLQKWGHFHTYDYSLGFIAGWGAHPLDYAQWVMKKDGTSPVTYEGTGTLPPKGAFDTIDTWDVNCHYEDGLTLRFMDSRNAEKKVAEMKGMKFHDHGTTFFGEDGWINVSRLGVQSNDESLLRQTSGPPDVQIYHSDSHPRNFVDCMRSRKQPISPLEAAIRSDTISHLSDFAIRLKRPIKWDPEAEQIVGDEEASKMLDRPMRQPYTM